MEEEKTLKQKPHTSINRRLSVAKKLRVHDNCQEKMLKFYFIGKYGKWYYGFLFNQ